MARGLDRMAHEEPTDHTDSPSIATDILVNVNRPWRPQGCKCTEIMNQIRGAGSGWCPPCTNGHIFFTGREYQGPKSSCLTNHNINIPAPSNWDLKRVHQISDTAHRHANMAVSRISRISPPNWSQFGHDRAGDSHPPCSLRASLPAACASPRPSWGRP